MLTLYAYTFRSRAERILWLLNELGLDHQVIRITPREIKKFNPLGKVPAIEHNGEIYTESLAIMEYLVSLTSRTDLVPFEGKEIYKFRNFIYYLLSEVESYLWVAQQASNLKAFYTWPEGTYSESILRVKNNITPLYTQLSSSGYVCSRFTIADIYAYHVFTWVQSHGLMLPESVLEYLKNLEKRSSFPIEMKSLA